MSLCNTFRLFVISLIIVLSIDKPAAFTLRRTTSEPKDLAQEETVLLEVINVNGRNDSFVNNRSKSNSSYATNKENTSHKNDGDFKDINRRSNIISTKIPVDDSTTKTQATTVTYKTTTGAETMFTDVDLLDEKPSYATIFLQTVTEPLETRTEEVTTTNSLKQVSMKEFTDNRPFTYETTVEMLSTTETIPKTTAVIEKPETTITFKSPKSPSWKKYKTIERKRIPHISEEKKNTNKTEEMVKAETKSRVTLQDTITSVIPSLDQLKNLFTSSENQKKETKHNVTETTVTEERNTESSTNSDTSTSKWDTVESKRAGYFDLSEKYPLTEYLIAKETFDLNIPKEHLRAMFVTDSETDIFEGKLGSKVESQSQLNDDVIKEELLKEEMINNNEENIKRSGDNLQTSAETESSYKLSNSTSSDNLSVRPIHTEKFKNSSLYTVNPNYKPLKKIEVKPPKPFVRDPDDNSWRNESLSSLGIVFNPKNSSKPFTQVLKNKTETELNNLAEKDNKNDTPDLRERLQKMAEKRKSKRKKTDLFGNVYFDYEENSNSVEHTTEEISSTTEVPNTTLDSAVEKPETTSSITTTTEKVGKGTDIYTTRKYKKFFNIPEYYDTTDEDDTEYLNMAKIDIKKFTTSQKTTSHTTHTTTAPLTLSWFSRTPYTNDPGRKATIQYFPPLTKTTPKVNFNDYDTDFKYKVDAFTETESPKQVLSVDTATPHKIVQYKPNDGKLNENIIKNKPNLDTNLYLTQSPQTTQTASLNDDDFDRDSYVIRHFKDFINVAAKHSEFDKNLDYTETPLPGLTKPAIHYETEPKINMNDYDYETQFRKDVLQRFVDNFNRNSDRFKSHFPVLFNSSIIHGDAPHGGDVASSRAFMRGLYTGVKAKPKTCDPNCENMTVELSPSYELHYYVPEQEEKEEVVPQVTLPYPYRL